MAHHIPAGGVIVEIGTGQGGTAVFLRNHAPNAVIATVDPYPLAGVAEHLASGNITQMPMTSAALAQHWNPALKVDLLFVDGGHTLQDLATDITSWHPHMSAGGVMVFDDYKPIANRQISNIAIGICLEGYIASGALELIEVGDDMLAARSVAGGDALPECARIFQETYIEKEVHAPLQYELTRSLPERFWDVLTGAKDKISMRDAWTSLVMLNHAMETVPPDLTTVGGLSRAIALEQCRLDCLERICQGFLGHRHYTLSLTSKGEHES